MLRFVSIGECMVELSADAPGLWRQGIAGDTLNTAWYARALLPADWSVAYATRLGLDAFSDQAIAFMAENGIETGLVTRHPSRSIGLYTISLQDGERSFTYWREVSAARTLADDADALQRAVLGADHVHVSGITLAILPEEGRQRLIGLLGQRKAAGRSSSFDPNHRPRLWASADEARAVIAATAAACSIVLPSFEDEQALFGDADPAATLRRYAGTGADVVVVKNAGRPVTACQNGAYQNGDSQNGQPMVISGLPAVTPVDTTGAGDSFNAGFLAAWLQGQGLEAAVRAAHALACRVVLHPGALVPQQALRAQR